MDNTLICSSESELLIEAEREWITSELKKYDISYTRGFLPDQNPPVTFLILTRDVL
jgi:hypothetical protein